MVTISVLKILERIVRYTEREFKRIDSKMILSMLLDETKEYLHVEVNKEFSKFKKEMELLKEQILQKIRDSYKVTATRSVQTVDTIVKHKGIQCGVTCVSQVKVR